MTATTPPAATYRLQLTSQFGFEQASALAPYLADLGIGALYCSPVSQAAPGSTHGYNVLDHQRLSEELGGPDGWDRLHQSLRTHNLGLLLDIVPNHMTIAGPNPLWRDVLENGHLSPYACYFDIDWDAPETSSRNKVLLPFLRDPYDVVLQSGQILLRRDGGQFVVSCSGATYPLSPESICEIISHSAAACSSGILAFLADAMRLLPSAPGQERIQTRHRDGQAIFDLLAKVLARDATAAQAVDAIIAKINSDPDQIDAVLARQHYRLAWWRLAGSEINYRRFFSIDSLAGLRVELEPVFQHAHKLVLQWAREGKLAGLRVDHIDGLYDPQAYLERLRDQTGGTWTIVEKILQPDETLPSAWPVAGTTGYDFLNKVGGLFVDGHNEEIMTKIYADFTGEPTDYLQMVRQKKHQILRESFGGQWSRLTGMLKDIAMQYRPLRDFSRCQLRDAIGELIAVFPLYRTYVRDDAQPALQDSGCITRALELARMNRPDLDSRLWDPLADVLLRRWPAPAGADFVLRLQQITPAITAKGVEDTAFYAFNRLVSLNEVGGDPSQFGSAPETFHRYCQFIQQHYPATLLATSTHDTKRGEDVRLRISMLSEIPQAWSQAVRRWSAMNAPRRSGDSPSRNAEYLLYQTLVGAWPISADRLAAYMIKAAREEKARTSWTDPDGPYEAALDAFTRGILADGAFIADLEAFVQPLRLKAQEASLAQTLIKCTAPGIPDFYQGAELWDLSLVDPDNRRPVDFAMRRQLLAELDRSSVQGILSRMEEGLPKLFVIHRCLQLRRRRPELFDANGDYQPLFAQGPCTEHVLAFMRGGGAITITPRLLVRLAGDWKGAAIQLPPGRWNNEFTAGSFSGLVTLADVLSQFPVALLVNASQ